MARLNRSKRIDAFLDSYLGRRIPAVFGFILTVLLGIFYWLLYFPVLGFKGIYLIVLFLHDYGNRMKGSAIAFKEGRRVEP